MLRAGAQYLAKQKADGSLESPEERSRRMSKALSGVTGAPKGPTNVGAGARAALQKLYAGQAARRAAGMTPFGAKGTPRYGPAAAEAQKQRKGTIRG